MGRSPSAAKTGLKKGPWDPEEDKKLVDFIEKHGPRNWISLPKLAGLNRCGKSCRLRWINYLRPDIKRGGFTAEEEQTILRLHSILGNKWSAIAMQLPGRTDNEVKNFWNTQLKKRLIRMGCDPMTHEPRTDLTMTTCLRLLAMANLRSLLNHIPLDVNAVYKLPYLEQLLQSTGTGAPSLVNSIPSLLLLLKENPILNSLSQLENQASFSHGATIPQPLHHPITTAPLTSPTLPLFDPQVLLPPIFQTTPFDAESGQSGGFLQGDNLTTDNIYQWDFQSDSGIVPSFMTETTTPTSNLGDVTSSSNLYGDCSESSSPWTEIFFDDPTFQ